MVGNPNYHQPVPIYEFTCRSCGHRFEELVGSQVGLDAADVSCPECGAAEVERLLSPSAPLQRQMTPKQRHRLEERRGTNRGGAKERFKQQRAAEKRTSARRKGGS